MTCFQMRFAVALWALAALPTFAAAAHDEPSRVLIDGARIFPESMDVGSNGALYVGSIGQGAVYRAQPGAKTATQWISKSAGKLSAVLGVVADDAHGRLWICSSDLNRLGEPVSLKTFDIKTGALLKDYPFINHKGLCNDIAIAKDGTAYATDTPNARVFRLKPGAAALEIWAKDPRWVGIDGISFGLDGALYVTNVRTGLLYRIAIQPDGAPGAITQLKTSRPLKGPDGFRLTKDGRFAIAENAAGRVSLGTLNGDTMDIQTLKDGFDFPASVGVGGDTIWTAEMKIEYRKDPALLHKDAKPFWITPMPLPPKR
jgi:sugar lactone lactonase YvrE